MKTIITGGTGLVGSEFSDKCIKLSSKDVNLINQKEVDLFFEKEEPDNVIHCAAKVGGVLNNMSNKGSFFYENVMMNTNVIHSSFKHGVKNLVAFLSTCVFPVDVSYPLTEDKMHLGPPHFSNNSYAYSKRMLDIQIKAYKEQYGTNYKCVIPCNIYGPNDNFNLINGHVIPSIVHKCYIAKNTNTPLTIWGNGEPLREFIFSRDVAFLSEWILENYNEEEPIILSSSQEISIREVVNLVVELMEFDGKVVWDESKPNGQYRKPSDNSKIKKYLPDFQFTSLREGLKETVDFVKNNYNIIRK